MELRITFRSEVFLQGKDMKDIAKKLNHSYRATATTARPAK